MKNAFVPQSIHSPNPLGSEFPLWYFTSGSLSVPQLLAKIKYQEYCSLANQACKTFTVTTWIQQINWVFWTVLMALHFNFFSDPNKICHFLSKPDQHISLSKNIYQKACKPTITLRDAMECKKTHTMNSIFTHPLEIPI